MSEPNERHVLTPEEVDELAFLGNGLADLLDNALKNEPEVRYVLVIARSHDDDAMDLAGISSLPRGFQILVLERALETLKTRNYHARDHGGHRD